MGDAGAVGAHELVIRAAELRDLDRVLAVHAEHHPTARGTGPASTREVEMWRRMLQTADLTVYLADEGDATVATASLLLMPNLTYDCAPTAFIEAVVVVPHRRRQGIATAMLERILADARRAGCNKVQLLSHKRHADDGAHDLYRKAGFDSEAEGFRLYLQTDS
jgi:GNAT superfamily N-acetyltransferase